MPELQIPADLTLLLRRAAIYRYHCACDFVGARQVGVNFESQRANVVAAENALELVGCDVTAPEPIEVALGPLVTGLIEEAIEGAIEDIREAESEQEMLALATTIRRLRALLAAPEGEVL